MTIKVYEDTAANAIYFENQLGAFFLNNLQAVVADAVEGLVSINDKARDQELVTSVDFSRFVDENDAQYGTDATDTCNQLNAIFSHAGSSSGVAPTITSSTTVNVTEGDVINYELTADFGVGFEWSNLPAGLVPVEGNVRKLVGGSGLSAGTYTATARAVNYFGEDTQDIDFVVSLGPYANTKSIRFNNSDYLGANAALLDGVLGRTGNGTGSGDAWSISLWFKPGTASNANQTIFYFGSQDVANGGYLQLKYDGGSQQIITRYGTNNNRLELRSPNSSVTVGQWHHLLFTYDGGTTGASSGSLSTYYGRFGLYIDGSSVSLTGSNQNFGYTGSISGTNLRVGRWNNGQSLRNNTFLDELAVWDSDQSSNIVDIYNSGLTHDLVSLTSAPSHYWRMGDGDTYPTILDQIGTAHFVMTNMTAADIVNDVP